MWRKGHICVWCCSVAQSGPTLCNPMTVAHQAPLSIGFSRKEHWSGLPCPSPGVLPGPGMEPISPALAGGSFTTKPPGKPHICIYCQGNCSVSSSGLSLEESQEERHAHKSQGLSTYMCKYCLTKKIPLLENYSMEILTGMRGYSLWHYLLKQNTGNNPYAHHMETAEYKLWSLYTRDDYAKLSKNAEVLSLWTWEDLQSILCIENTACRTMWWVRHPLCEARRSGRSLCCKCTNNPGRMRKKVRMAVVRGEGETGWRGRRVGRRLTTA